MGNLLWMLLVLLALIGVSIPPCSGTGPQPWQQQQDRQQQRQHALERRIHPQPSLTADHPDLPGLFALRDSVCSAPACLPSWRPASTAAAAADPCGSAFEGVECGAGGRVIAVSIRLDPALIAFADYSPSTGSPRIPNLAELSIVCPSPPANRNGGGLLGKTAPVVGSAAAAAAAAVAVHRRPGGGSDPQPKGPGSLPGAWGSLMPGLRHLKVDGCGAEGGVPAALAARKSLVTLSLPRNALTEWLQDLSGLPALQLLDLSHNALSSPLPVSWAAPALRYLYIGGNPGLATPGALPAAWAESFPQLMLADVSPPPGSGAAEAPRPWARAFCAREGAFVCLAAEAESGSSSNGGNAHHGGGGSGYAAACGAYFRGTSAKHWDWRNRCDHPSQAAPLATAWLAVAAAAAALIAWHRHRLREDAAAMALGGGADSHGWVLTPGTSPHPSRLQAQAPMGRAHQVSPFAAYAQVGDGGAAGPSGSGSNNASSSRSSSVTQPRRAAQQRSGGSGTLAVPLLATGGDESLPSTSYGPSRNDSAHLPSALAFQTPPRWGAGAAAVVQAARARARAEAASAAGTSAPGVPGPLARLTAASNGFVPGGSSSSAAGLPASTAAPVPAAAPSFMDHLLPLAAAGADAAAFTRVVILWGVSPAGPAFWPSYVLIGLLAAPHVSLAAVELLRAIAAAAVPAALRAASPAAPLERGVAGIAGWVSMAPWWVAYPALAVLAGPGLALLSALLPLTLPLHMVGLVSHEAALHYTRLLQACSALTLAPAAATLLSVLLLLGNTPASRAFLTPNLFWVPFLCAAADMLTGLHLALARSREARRQSALAKQRTRPLPRLGP